MVVRLGEIVNTSMGDVIYKMAICFFFVSVYMRPFVLITPLFQNHFLPEMDCCSLQLRVQSIDFLFFVALFIKLNVYCCPIKYLFAFAKIFYYFIEIQIVILRHTIFMSNQNPQNFIFVTTRWPAPTTDELLLKNYHKKAALLTPFLSSANSASTPFICRDGLKDNKDDISHFSSWCNVYTFPFNCDVPFLWHFICRITVELMQMTLHPTEELCSNNNMYKSQNKKC